jgi:hypothetical protein
VCLESRNFFLTITSNIIGVQQINVKSDGVIQKAYV